MMRKHKVMRHYKGLMKKYDAGNEQLIGYHADFGGRIELIQQGFDEHGIVRKYDEKSSYPHKCVIMPSMIGGFWIKRELAEFDWGESEQASPVSMFMIRWLLPERSIDAHGYAGSSIFPASLPARRRFHPVLFHGARMVLPRRSNP